MDKFSYQIVFKLYEDERIIFAGVTTLDFEVLMNNCYRCLSDDWHDKVSIENFVYQPFKEQKNES